MVSYLLKEATCSESDMLGPGPRMENENNCNAIDRCLTAEPSAARLVSHRGWETPLVTTSMG